MLRAVCWWMERRGRRGVELRGESEVIATFLTFKGPGKWEHRFESAPHYLPEE